MTGARPVETDSSHHQRPPPGRAELPLNTTFKKTFSIPVLGTQFVGVRVLSPETAFVTMHGVITTREAVHYTVRHGRIFLGFSQKTLQLFDSYGTKFTSAFLSADMQTVLLYMRPPLYNHDVKITLIRTTTSFEQKPPNLARDAAANSASSEAPRRASESCCLIC